MSDPRRRHVSCSLAPTRRWIVDLREAGVEGRVAAARRCSYAGSGGVRTVRIQAHPAGEQDAAVRESCHGVTAMRREKISRAAEESRSRVIDLDLRVPREEHATIA